MEAEGEGEVCVGRIMVGKVFLLRITVADRNIYIEDVKRVWMVPMAI